MIWINVGYTRRFYHYGMDQVTTLRRYRLFDAKVPRYTSYPPANRFVPDTGARVHRGWLGAVGAGDPVSVYVHIPFCRRLCWFCACRTQGTKTLSPVANYVDTLLAEVATVAEGLLPPGLRMRRLHLGGGTPTLLSPELMEALLNTIKTQLTPDRDFEFSVEIDPTEVTSDILNTLCAHRLTRASIGVQDFDPDVQKAIGRMQGFEQTRKVVTALRQRGVKSLNIDLLYGLPFQTPESLIKTLDRVVVMQPDRIALYGYAHVPHVSKRQVMIPSEALPDAEQRFVMAQITKERLLEFGYEALGIDHFALPHDSLTKAAAMGMMSRNFQGYTDDPCATLLGFGASAISKFPQGYVQNAVSTSAYAQRVEAGGTAAHKGVILTADDYFVAALIDQMMCHGRIDASEIIARFPARRAELAAILSDLQLRFPDLLKGGAQQLEILPQFSAAARLIAAHLDQTRQHDHIHSLAV